MHDRLVSWRIDALHQCFLVKLVTVFFSGYASAIYLQDSRIHNTELTVCNIFYSFVARLLD